MGRTWSSIWSACRYEPLLAQNESSGSSGGIGVRSSNCADLGLSSNCKGQTIGNATGIYSLLVGFIISLFFIVIVSMVTKAPDETILAQFDEYKKYEEKDM